MEKVFGRLLRGIDCNTPHMKRLIKLNQWTINNSDYPFFGVQVDKNSEVKHAAVGRNPGMGALPKKATNKYGCWAS